MLKRHLCSYLSILLLSPLSLACLLYIAEVPFSYGQQIYKKFIKNTLNENQSREK